MRKPDKHLLVRTALSRGFTILELVIVIAIFAILTSIVVARTVGVSGRARDVERIEDIASIGRQLEDVYSTKKLGTPTYPDTVQITGTVVFKGVDPETLKSPKASSSSITAASNANTSTSGITPSPTTSQYVYQPLTSLGALCTSGLECVRYNLYYRTETDNTVWQEKSLHQQ
ncbi:type II secretion system protein [Pedobacter sp.]|nr:type II secretion system protein [Candidatus Saccharibacteria bacterium]